RCIDSFYNIKSCRSHWKLKTFMTEMTTDEVEAYCEVEDEGYKSSGILASLSETATTVASYSLQDGLQVLVCEGDITKQNLDALVNAANEDLDHHGGVAAALSKAGGPEVQKESSTLVKYMGKIPTGDVVVTTGGNLNCKTLLHAVGPVGGKAGGREKILLEQTIQKALNLSEMMEFQSIAIPCISSGVFGVPVTVCCEAIVTAVRKFGSQGGRSLNMDLACFCFFSRKLTSSSPRWMSSYVPWSAMILSPPVLETFCTKRLVLS
uniref:Macro domain-containing protein n=1 Tax=Amphiprion ocellaris TaxID=80972 RepID=A0AAQ5Y5C2_AMPOC